MSENKLRWIVIFCSLVSMMTACTNELRSYSKKRNSIVEYGHINDSTLNLTDISKDSIFGVSVEIPHNVTTNFRLNVTT